jgi:multicomponent Na+:H+ antiporter subunit E
MKLSPLLVLGLSGVWCLIVGEFSLRQWIVGLVVGTVMVLVTGWGREQRVSLARLPRQLLLLIFFVLILIPYHIVSANFQMAWRLLRGNDAFKPGIVRVKSGDLTKQVLGLEEQVITLTPGQLVVDYSGDDEMIYVHTIDVTDYEEKGEESILWMYQILKRIVT